MAIPSRLDDSKPLAIPPALHVFETFSSYEDYDTYDAAVLRPMIRSSHPYSYIYADKHPDLPLPVAFGPQRASIESVRRLILETDINRPSQNISFPHYIDCPPNQSATIPLPRRVTALGYFSLRVPQCFVLNIGEGLNIGDIVGLGSAGPRQAVIERVEEVGRYFVRYAIREVGSIPLESDMTTQLVAPLSSLQPFPLRFLAIIYVTLFAYFLRSSAVFGETPRIPHARGGDGSGSLDDVERGEV
jgi:hypothetical protein